MHKIFVALVAMVTLGRMSNPSQQLFNISPSVPVCGRDVKITHSGVLPIEIVVTFTPPGTSQTYTLTSAAPSIKVGVPANAVTMNVQDLSGQSADFNEVCSDR